MTMDLYANSYFHECNRRGEIKKEAKIFVHPLNMHYNEEFALEIFSVFFIFQFLAVA